MASNRATEKTKIENLGIYFLSSSSKNIKRRKIISTRERKKTAFGYSEKLRPNSPRISGVKSVKNINTFIAISKFFSMESFLTFLF